MKSRVLTAFIACLGFSSMVSAADQPIIGDQVQEFRLPSCYGREYSLSEFKQSELVVLAFLGTECPLVQLYAQRLQEIGDAYKSKGVVVLGINSNSQDKLKEIQAFGHKHNISFPLLKDLDNKLADQIGAIRTPEVFVLDRNRTIQYWGRIDDQYGISYSRDKPKRHDLRLAIDELLAQKPVTVASTESVGCYIGRVIAKEPTGDITYTKHVARILNDKCVECHRDDQIAPFSLASYDDTLGWGETIREVIEDFRMPPWNANPKHGQFRNNPRLSAEEKNLVFTWIKNGMPQGDPKNLPEPPEFAEGWRIDKPDQIVFMRNSKVPFDVPAQGVVDYQYFTVDPGWKEDKYVSAVEARPGNPAVVHHIIAYVWPPGARRFQLDNMLVGFAPGTPPTDLKNGRALYVPADSKLVFEMHYTPNGTAQSDLSHIGIKFIDKKDVTKVIKGRMAIDDRFTIPPHVDNYLVTSKTSIPRDSLLLDMSPHMHLRGKSFTFEAIYSDGRKETLLDVPKYDFNWQLTYELAEPKLLPKGTQILCTARFDNSANNLSNPDPSKPVRWGEQSWEEMMIGFFTVEPADWKDLKPPRFDISGTWQWTQSGQVSQLQIQMREDGKLSGHYVRGNLRKEIQNARVSDNKMWFEFPMVLNGNAVHILFEGTVSEQQIRGMVTFDSGLGSRSVPLVMLRESEKTASKE